MRFDVQRNPNRLRTIAILAGAFIVFSIMGFVIGGTGAGTMLLVVSGVMLVFFTVDQGKIGWHYRIEETELIVRRTFKEYRIPGSTIQSVSKTGWHGIWERVVKYRRGEIPGGAGYRQVALGRLIGFSAIPIPVRSDRRPAGPESFVVLRRSQGREYVLSPSDPEKFVKECQRLMSRSGH
ncbi:MAG: hypothetical protein ACLFSV_05145 [Alkalispirochaeta sp.]